MLQLRPIRSTVSSLSLRSADGVSGCLTHLFLHVVGPAGLEVFRSLTISSLFHFFFLLHLTYGIFCIYRYTDTDTYAKDTFCGSLDTEPVSWFWFADPYFLYRSHPCLQLWNVAFSSRDPISLRCSQPGLLFPSPRFRLSSDSIISIAVSIGLTERLDRYLAIVYRQDSHPGAKGRLGSEKKCSGSCCLQRRRMWP